MPAASMKQLLESGVHFGHQTRRWNPKMKPYIFTERGGIHIIDLQQTTVLLDRSYDFVRNIAGRGGVVLFVGTKKQCQDIIREEASRVGMPFVSHRWLGGLLTNFSTIENRIKRMHELRALKEEGQLALLPTKERMAMERELEKLEVNLGGVGNMQRLPDAVFVVDPKREAIATKEVNKLGLPLIGLVDTNCDPDEVDYLIPGNDDAIRSCSLIVKTLARAVEEGRQKIQATEFLVAEAGEAVGKDGGERASVSAGDTGMSGAREVPAPRPSRVGRTVAGDGRQGTQGRSGGTGRGGPGGRSAGPGRQSAREGGPQRGAPARNSMASKAASGEPAKREKVPAVGTPTGAVPEESAAESAEALKQPIEEAAPTEAPQAAEAPPTAEAPAAAEAPATAEAAAAPEAPAAAETKPDSTPKPEVAASAKPKKKKGEKARQPEAAEVEIEAEGKTDAETDAGSEA